MSALHVLVVSILIVLGAAEGTRVSRPAFAKWRAQLFGRNSVQNTPSGMCAKAVDIGIVLDRTAVRSANDSDIIMEFFENLTRKFEISDDMTHIGIISFDETSAELLLDFWQGSTLEAVQQQMKPLLPAAEAKNGPHAVDKALNLAIKLFTDDYGARGYDEVLLFLTDGHYNIATPRKLVDELKEHNVKVIMVGIGRADPIQLFMLSSDLNALFFIHPLIDTAENVKKIACDTLTHQVESHRA